MSTGKQKPRSIFDLHQDRSFLISMIGLLIILLASVLLIEQFGGSAKLAELVQSAGPWAPVTFILAKALTYVIAPLSGGPIKIIAGALFGFIPGVIYSTLGDLLGATINFWIARLVGREALHRFSSKKTAKKVDEFVAHIETWKTLLFARVVLSGFYDFISYTAGLSKMRYKTFFWVTLVGGIPGSALAVGFGSTIFANTGLFVALIIGVVVLFAVSYWINDRLEKRNKKKN